MRVFAVLLSLRIVACLNLQYRNNNKQILHHYCRSDDHRISYPRTCSSKTSSKKVAVVTVAGL